MADKCKVHGNKIARCDLLIHATEYGNPTSRSKGLFLPERVHIKTGKPGTDIVQIHSGQYVGRGIAVNYCPFCGESLNTWDMRGVSPLCVKSSNENDPRDAFEKIFSMPAHVERCGTGYCVTSYNAWDGHKFVERWEGWKACLAAGGTVE